MKRVLLYLVPAVSLIAMVLVYKHPDASATTFSADPTASFNGGDRRYSTRKIAMTPYDPNTMPDVALSLCQSFIPTRTTMANYLDALVYGTAQPADYRIVIVGNVANEIDQPTSILSETVGPEDITYVPTAMAVMPESGVNYLPMTRFYNGSGDTVSLTAGQKYWLCLASNDYESDEIMVWYSGLSWSGGKARAGNSPYSEIEKAEFVTDTEDFGFTVYTQEAETPPPAQEEEEDQTPAPTTPTTQTTTTTTASTPSAATSNTSTTPTTTTAPSISQQAGVSQGSGAAPATPTASIKAPSELVVADFPADQGGALKLDWKASATTNIDGYKVFRSTDEKNNFAEIAKTTKDVITLTDPGATLGTRFYYMVRAYKGSGESASSNTANGVSTDNTAPAAPNSLAYQKTASGNLNFTWASSTETDLAGYVLLVIDPKDTATTVLSLDIEKTAISYNLEIAKHKELKAGVTYKYYLTAKDAAGNISERTEAQETKRETAATTVENKTKKQAPTLWYALAGVAVLGGGGTGFFIWRLKKPKLPKVKPPITPQS